jgi:membrane-bound lytic murein transglycosylase D
MNNLKLFSIGLFALSTTFSYSQAQTNSESFEKPAPKSYLDSLKQTFVTYEMSDRIDELWMKELTNQELFAEMYSDITNMSDDEEVSYDLSTELLKKRLALLDEKSPFNVVYNKSLENLIKSFLKNRSKSYERLMALSEYYFPMFEEHLAKYNLPLEIKYLAIVESALNPHAKSYVGASGLWQFMYATGKQYKLEVNSFVDERYDPLKATDAACQYFTNMYKIFGDWDLVLASYNTGPGNVTKAIRRSGGKKNYWNLRPYLHKETQGYLPAFYATMYIYEYHKEHGINPKKAPVSFFETDTVMVKKRMDFNQISDLLDIPIEQVKFLNPIYKAEIIPYMSNKPHYLRLPKDKIAVFQSNEDKIYAYLDYTDSKLEKPFETTLYADNSSGDVITKTRIHKVKKGETLGTIAAKNKVSIANLRRWNGIKGNTVRIGQNLKIQSVSRVAATTTKPTPQNEVQKVEDSKEKLADTTNSIHVKHIIKPGETLDIIAAKYKVAVADLKTWNNISGNKIFSGKSLIINTDQATENLAEVVETPKEEKTTKKDNTLYKEAKTKEQTYTVRSGDTLYDIANKNGVTIAQLKKANNLKSEKLKPGQVLKI